MISINLQLSIRMIILRSTYQKEQNVLFSTPGRTEDFVILTFLIMITI